MLNSPFLQAGANRSLSSNLLKTSKFSLNGVLTNLEKTVSTINQVVPLYNQVKPLISNSKTLLNLFKSTVKPNKGSVQQNENNTNIVNVNYNEVKQYQTIDDNYTDNIFTNKNMPNRPFFN